MIRSAGPSGRFSHDHYLLRRNLFSLLGARFQVFDAGGRPVFFSKQKAFKLREDIRVYADETMSEEVLLIQAMQVLDFSAAYEVRDPADGVVVGMLRRKGFSSLLRDSWQVLDASGRDTGEIHEDSMFLALLRRLLVNLIPQKFVMSVDGRVVAEFQQRFNPFIYKMEMNYSGDASCRIDRRLFIAAGILLAAIEGRQD